jgi:hypothetical protein
MNIGPIGDHHPLGCRCQGCSYTPFFYQPLAPQPWTCPKCQSIYGPAAHECHRCNPPVSYTVTCIAQGKGDG